MGWWLGMGWWLVMGLGVAAGVDGYSVDGCGVLDLVGRVEHRRVLRRGRRVAGGVDGPVVREAVPGRGGGGRRAARSGRGEAPDHWRGSAGGLPAAPGESVRFDFLISEERVAVVGV